MHTAHWYVMITVLPMMVITFVHVQSVIMVVAIFLPQKFFYKRGRKKNSSWITDHSCCESWVCMMLISSRWAHSVVITFKLPARLVWFLVDHCFCLWQHSQSLLAHSGSVAMEFNYENNYLLSFCFLTCLFIHLVFTLMAISLTHSLNMTCQHLFHSFDYLIILRSFVHLCS